MINGPEKPKASLTPAAAGQRKISKQLQLQRLRQRRWARLAAVGKLRRRKAEIRPADCSRWRRRRENERER